VGESERILRDFLKISLRCSTVYVGILVGVQKEGQLCGKMMVLFE